MTLALIENLPPDIEDYPCPERPNGLRLSGDGGEADGVRCSRGLGPTVLGPELTLA